MNPRILPIALVALLAAGALPVVGAAQVDLDETPQATELAPTALTLPCLLNLLFCTQCNDGRDNDGDGFVDTTDPSCTSSSDNDEYDCVRRSVYANVWTTGPKYSTEVYASPDILFACPGGARFAPPYAGECYNDLGWVVSGCTQSNPLPNSWGWKGTFTCNGSSSCSPGTVSPHTMNAAVQLIGTQGDYQCVFNTGGAPALTSCEKTDWW